MQYWLWIRDVLELHRCLSGKESHPSYWLCSKSVYYKEKITRAKTWSMLTALSQWEPLKSPIRLWDKKAHQQNVCGGARLWLVWWYGIRDFSWFAFFLIYFSFGDCRNICFKLFLPVWSIVMSFCVQWKIAVDLSLRGWIWSTCVFVWYLVQIVFSFIPLFGFVIVYV